MIDRLLVSLGVFIFGLIVVVFELVRRRKLKERHAALWLILAVLVGIGLVFSDFAGSVARFLGFDLVSNLVIVFGLMVLVFISLQLSVEVGRLRDIVERLTSEVAILGVEAAEDADQRDRVNPGPSGSHESDN